MLRFVFCLLPFLLVHRTSTAQTFTLFTGSYTRTGNGGIHVYTFNATTGTTVLLDSTTGVSNPSYLAVSKNGVVYAVNEDGGGKGAVSAFRWDGKKLSFINTQPSGGDHPCYVAIHPSGRWLAVGNYSGGNLALYALREDGSIAAADTVINHTGRSVDATRQQSPHVHATVWSPDGTALVVPDLGTDELVVYRFNEQSPAKLQPVQSMKSAPGAGPRHFIFGTNGFAYSIEELSGTVVSFQYKERQLQQRQRISTHPKNYTGAKGSADIHLSPDGRFLYATNRAAANTIASFAVQKNGRLKLLRIQSTLGVHPRNFTLDPTGRWLLVANRDSNEIVVFQRNTSTGALIDSGKRMKTLLPICVKFMQ